MIFWNDPKSCTPTWTIVLVLLFPLSYLLQVFSSYEEFDEYVTPIITSCNPHRNQVELFKLKKAKWFQTLDPVIPEHMKFVEESIDDDDDDFEWEY